MYGNHSRTLYRNGVQIRVSVSPAITTKSYRPPWRLGLESHCSRGRNTVHIPTAIKDLGDDHARSVGLSTLSAIPNSKTASKRFLNRRRRRRGIPSSLPPEIYRLGLGDDRAGLNRGPTLTFSSSSGNNVPISNAQIEPIQSPMLIASSMQQDACGSVDLYFHVCQEDLYLSLAHLVPRSCVRASSVRSSSK